MRASRCLLFAVCLTAGGAESVQFASGPAQVALIELFTSEGCSSCPPAEKWLGAQRDDPGLWTTFVPVAWHVTYWDRLGWPDRFASREGTQREYAFAAAWGGNSVYTPCFVRDGSEWRPAGGKITPVSIGQSGTLKATFDGAAVSAEFTPERPRGNERFEIHVALLGNGVVSKVTAGENSGSTLRHEFIALAVAHGMPGAKIPLASPHVAGVTRRALAIWVTRRDDLTPLQATGGWLPPGL